MGHQALSSLVMIWTHQTSKKKAKLRIAESIIIFLLLHTKERPVTSKLMDTAN